ncbi:ABC transporter substrate-binding protein [Vulcanisaeta sp. EB80]|uniref:ABC transporter substrate-binding protein n=1 Tax=Vulcanisaeta sp. EB80 TaxID=1650660 RepID=UPI0009BF07F0|nr:ABC transporter substrate-binding protein [Vulcanisaeta sp. EB80]PLC68300.1 ABC transporter substrate-binding protein [Vulcanisaeta sp. EB80]
MSSGISKATIVGAVLAIVVIVAITYYLVQMAHKPQSPHYPLSNIDYLGRNVTIQSQPSTIGIVSPDCAQIVYMLGLGNKVVLLDIYSKQLLNYLGVTVPSNATIISSIYPTPPLEPILLAHPSLICADAGFNYQFVEDTGTLADSGIAVIFIGGTDNTNVTGIYNDVTLVAKALGVTSRGELVVGRMGDILNYVRSHVTNAQPVTVAYLSWYNPIYVAGNSSFIGYYITVAGGYDPFTGMYPTITPTQLIIANPDYIIADDFMGNYSATLQAILSIPGINTTNAVKEGHVYILGNLAQSLIEEPGPLSVYGALLLAMILHPSSFGLNSTEIPHYISSQWVMEYVKPNLNLTLSG